MVAAYHIFESHFGSIDFGNEFDVGVAYPLMQKLTGKLEYADYNAVDAASGKFDTRKFWLTLIFNY